MDSSVLQEFYLGKNWMPFFQERLNLYLLTSGFYPLHLRDGLPGLAPPFLPGPNVAGHFDERAPSGSTTRRFDAGHSYKVEHLFSPIIELSLLYEEISPAKEFYSFI